MRVLTAAEIRGLESCAVESGVSMETLMENAGAEVAAAVTEKMDVTGKKTVILCGKGNNGGDGFVAARLLAAEGAKVTVVLMQGAPASDRHQRLGGNARLRRGDPGRFAPRH